MPSWLWVLIAIGVVVVLALVVWRALAQRRTGKLQQQFGVVAEESAGPS